MNSVWIIDDDRSIRWVLEKALGREGIECASFGTADEALAALAAGKLPRVLVSDIRMPGTSGLDLLRRVKQEHPDLPVIIMTAYSDLDSAVAAFQGGAFEYLPKPFDVDQAVALVRRALEQGAPQIGASPAEAVAPEILGQAPAMQEVFRAIGRLSQSHATVLINGESGTGKELVARALHRHSPRKDGPFVAINTAAIPRDLLESELFGHEKGAFTGANTLRRGRFEEAAGGTLFLDEIGDMGEEAQAKVLRAVEESRFQRVGGAETRRVDVRIIAATNRDLSSPQSGFRQDLFYRLNVLSLHLPPLREREGDVPLLLDWFMAELAARLKLKPRRFAPETVAILGEYSWPGNVRELRNLVERLLILAPDDVVRPGDLPPLPGLAHSRPEDSSLFAAKDFQEFKTRSETVFLQAKLKENLYNVSRTADVLGMQRSNLYKKIAKYGLRTQPGE